MPKIQGHILTDDVVVNYKNSDRDDCLHFLTHVDTSCHNLASIISPTVKKIYTSTFTAWCLKMNFDVKHIDIQGFDTNKSYKITYRGNKYIYSFIDTKFTTGSVALLLHGVFGSYLYTGNFCYYQSFVKSPVLLPVIKEKALTRLYLDNTYYEQPSDFLGFDEIASKVTALIKSEPMKFFYIYAEKVTMDPLIAEIASKLEEKVYVCQSTMEIMKILGFESFFTRLSYRSRIFINKTIIKTKNFEQNNITVYLNRFSDSCKSFQKIEKKGSVYNFNFYCHSNHKEICELLRVLKPDSMTFLFSEISNKQNIPTNPVKKTLQPVNVGDARNKAVNKIPGKLILSKIINDNTLDVSKKNIISKNQGSLKLKSSVINLDDSTSDNPDIPHLHSTEYKCPLRIRKVPEINNAGLSNKPNCIKEVGINNCDEKITSIKEVNYNNSNEINDSGKNSSDPDDCHKPKQLLKLIKLQDNNLARKIMVPNNTKTSSPYVVHSKTGVPLIFKSRLITENGMNGTNSKIMEISNIGMISNGKKNTILVKRKYVDVDKPCLITVPPDETQKSEMDHVENEKNFEEKKPIILLKSGSCETDSDMKEPSSVVNSSEVFLGSRVNNSDSVPNNSFQILENTLKESEELISSESKICNIESNQSGASEKNMIDQDRYSDTLEDSINLQLENNNQPSEMPVGFHLQDNQQTCNEKNNIDDSTISTVERSIVGNNAVRGSSSKSTYESDLEPLKEGNINSNESEVCENNCQVVTKDISNIISKRCLSNHENGQSSKKLRSESFRQCPSQTNLQKKESVSLGKCITLIRRNSYKRSYFYSSQHDCYLPKFCGFKKHEVRPRNILIALRNLQKLLKN